eukprot:3709671-Pleurochrysis_carterae.AAC.1
MDTVPLRHARRPALLSYIVALFHGSAARLTPRRACQPQHSEARLRHAANALVQTSHRSAAADDEDERIELVGLGAAPRHRTTKRWQPEAQTQDPKVGKGERIGQEQDAQTAATQQIVRSLEAQTKRKHVEKI